VASVLMGQSGARGRDWFSSRRDHFVRQVVCGFFHLIEWFHALYADYLHLCDADYRGGGRLPDQPVDAVQTVLLQQISQMVGTEKNNGPLWQLKDLCHQVWPQEEREQYIHGVLVDWLIGSLFHEAMKLKENLYLLNNYGSAALAINNLADRHSLRYRQLSAISHLVDIPTLIKRIAGDFARQMERMGFLFGQVNYLLRLMLPELVENMLIVRLLVEQEKTVVELWGESLETLFNDIFSGGAATGFCMAGSSYFRGQWYRQALAMYERAFACDRQCDEAIARIAHLKAVLRNNPGLLNGY
jgi:hypothetical protein